MWRSGSSSSFFDRVFGFGEAGYAATQQALLKCAKFTEPSPSSVAHGVTTTPAPSERCVLTLEDGTEIDAGIFMEGSVGELNDRLRKYLSDPEVKEKLDEFKEEHKRPHMVRFRNLVGESRALHSVPAFKDAVIQAASQFNYLEFASPGSTPEIGIGPYEYDRTQGPACAIACAAGTAYRNYLLPALSSDGGSEKSRGQVKAYQRNGLAELERQFAVCLRDHAEEALPGGGDSGYASSRQDTFVSQSSTASVEPGSPGSPGERNSDIIKLPWRVQSGYIEASPTRLGMANALLRDPFTRDLLRPLLRIGIQEDSDVLLANADADPGTVVHKVTQVYCSAISCGYSRCSTETWEPLATLVLEACYEATFLVAAFKAVEAIRNGRQPPRLLLTKVGGGVFGNEQEWIQGAMQRAAKVTAEYGVPVDAIVVHYGQVEDGYENDVVQSWSV